MKSMIKRLSRGVTCIVTSAAMLVVLAATPVWAAPEPNPTDQLKGVIDRATGWLVGILVTVATFFATLGGVRRMTAGDDVGEIEKSKGSFRNAFYGYALAALAPIAVRIAKAILGV